VIKYWKDDFIYPGWGSFTFVLLFFKLFNHVWTPTILFQSDTCGYPATFVKSGIISPTYVMGSFIENQMSLSAKICIWVFNSVLFWSSYLFLC
jgi:hypothetical protein